MWDRILEGTVWERGALDHEPRKFRSLWRVWLPAYDFLVILAGIFALAVGSRLLDRIFGSFTDVLGGLFSLVGALCFLGIAYPSQWKLEWVSKCLLIGMVTAYVYCILFLPSPAQVAYSEAPNFFVATMLFVGLPLPLFRLNMLADEKFGRAVEARVQELLS